MDAKAELLGFKAVRQQKCQVRTHLHQKTLPQAESYFFMQSHAQQSHGHCGCICLKKVDSQKESIIMTPHTEFQKKYYQQVIEIHQKTGFSPRKIAKLQLVPVSVRQMYHWIAIFEAENGKGSPRRIMEAKKSKEQAEMESLKSRISELEESLRVERLRNRLNEKIIDIAEARWHIEIRKKAGTKR